MLPAEAAEQVLVDQGAHFGLWLRGFMNARNGMAVTNYYDDLFSRLIGDGVPLPTVIERVAGAYLDGKPLPVGKKKLTKKERDSLFWASEVVKGCPPEAWGGEAMSLAVARYLGQEPVAADGLVTRVAREAPDRAGVARAAHRRALSPRRADPPGVARVPRAPAARGLLRIGLSTLVNSASRSSIDVTRKFRCVVGRHTAPTTQGPSKPRQLHAPPPGAPEACRFDLT